MPTRTLRSLLTTPLLAAAAMTMLSGCKAAERRPESHQPVARPQVVVVAPVINLSGTEEFDALQVTDLVASELLSFPEISVIPVNLTLAALARMGKSHVETPADAMDLAREFGADATVVTAITEYDPYDPPVVGMVMQWYGLERAAPLRGFDPVSASREASAKSPAGLSAEAVLAPQLQVQRVFNAAHDAVLEDVRNFAAQRRGHAGPYAWRRYVKSQELYVRYCCWALIRTMVDQQSADGADAETDEAQL
ncbi:MAG: hypothetical protein KKB50_08500 [Planctomycetes bacterium]|nr:hypothetical protein [Planctomycetota bacterium]